MTRIVISQPMYFAWPGFFAQMQLADTFVWLDDAQFSRGSYTNRVQVKDDDKSIWMTIPLAGKGSFQKISELRSASEDWKDGHRSLLNRKLSGSPFLPEAMRIYELTVEKTALIDLLIASCEESAHYMGLRTPFYRASAFEQEHTSWRRVLDICKQYNASTYITGHGARNYLDHEAFERAGISVEYMQYSVAEWPQRGRNFTPFVTILDLISSVGPDAARYITSSTISWRAFLASQSHERVC